MGQKFKFKSSKDKEKFNLVKNNDDLFQKNSLSGAHIELFSNREIIIDGCEGVCDYNESYIHLKLCKNSLILYGNNFDIVRFESDIINIKGNITSMEFCIRGAK